MKAMTSPLDSNNPHGIRVVADRAPIRQDVKDAFAKGSRKASSGIADLGKRSASTRAATATKRAG
jgi:hypothetical protein